MTHAIYKTLHRLEVFKKKSFILLLSFSILFTQIIEASAATRRMFNSFLQEGTKRSHVSRMRKYGHTSLPLKRHFYTSSALINSNEKTLRNTKKPSHKNLLVNNVRQYSTYASEKTTPTIEYDFKKIYPFILKNQLKRNDFFCDLENPDSSKNKFYAIGMFPYPSGQAHMGHTRVFTITDVIARFKRLHGFNVLNPIGWDSFGLPAENAAIKNKTHPKTWTLNNIQQMKDEQFPPLGFSFDWSKEISTCNPDYYKWTQWFFIQFYKHNMTYQAEGFVNWCPKDQTVLANEQVIDNLCWRCSTPVERKKMKQWFIRVSNYADKLWKGLEDLKNWDQRAVATQKHWIGKKNGINVLFKVENIESTLEVFTDKPEEYILGISAIIVSPEHPIVDLIIKKDNDFELQKYVQHALQKTTLERISSKQKKAIPTNYNAIHPLSGNLIPIVVSDHILFETATGSKLCIPEAKESDDLEIVSQLQLKIYPVFPEEELPTVNAFPRNNIPNNGESIEEKSETLRMKVASALHEQGIGMKNTIYNLRDWSVSRQRYWGCPIPIIYCEDCGPVPVPEKDLPVLLPEKNNLFKDKLPTFPLKQDPIHVSCPSCGKESLRETDTLDTFMCSSWYVLRYLSANEEKQPFSSTLINQWMPIDLYVGALEHAAQHMIYLRTFVKILNDMGLVNFDEPVDRFFCNGIVTKNGQKMSKSLGNVVTPSEVVEKYGADALRVCILSDTPANLDFEWDERKAQNKANFVKKTYADLEKYLKIIKKDKTLEELKKENDIYLYPRKEFTKDFYFIIQNLEKNLEEYSFNNAIADLHTLSNLLIKEIKNKDSTKSNYTLYGFIKDYLIVSGIFMPFFSEILFTEYFDPTAGIYKQVWPNFDVDKLNLKKNYTVAVTINGKKVTTLDIQEGLNGLEISKIIKELPSVKKKIENRNIQKEIYIKNKIYNIVI